MNSHGWSLALLLVVNAVACKRSAPASGAPTAKPVAPVATSVTKSTSDTEVADTNAKPAPSTSSAKPEAKGTCKPGMVFIPAGTFTMGDDESTAKAGRVTVAAFCMDRTEVTVRAYAACVTSGKCVAASAVGLCNAGVPGRDNHPINCIDWSQARAYCEAQGLRLPSEEEWEYAARGTDGRLYPWGNEEPGEQLCWDRYGDTRANSTCPVGSYSKGNSVFGLADVAGNVWEWTSTDVDSGGRVARGGCWGADRATYVRAAFRNRLNPEIQYDFIGVRCAGEPLP
jgi:formylglycine-generating enzyme required for sulfatase activity